MAVITKKEEKVEVIITKRTNREDIEEFKTLFKATFTDGYAKMMKVYNADKR